MISPPHKQFHIRMGKFWTHSDLGRFKNTDDIAWEKDFEEPAFKAFRGNSSRFTLSFEIPFNWKDDQPRQPPGEGEAAIAQKVLSCAPKLVPVVLQALWDDFNGIGLSSGMWWENGLVLANGALKLDIARATGHVPQNPQELLPLLRLKEISIRSKVPRAKRPVAVFCFEAPSFEDEHGVGVITDGDQVLGLGYSLDCGLYQGQKKAKRKRK